MAWHFIKNLSNLEAKIDFPDEDIPIVILKNIKKDIDVVRKEIKKTLNDSKVGERIREGFKIAILDPQMLVNQVCWTIFLIER